MNYEGKGPHGVLIFVECATDNSNRSVTNVKTYFNKNGGQMVPSGSLEFLFSRKAAVEFQRTPELDLEEIELALIDAGLEELLVEDDLVTAFADYTSFSTLTHAFEQLGIPVKKPICAALPAVPWSSPRSNWRKWKSSSTSSKTMTMCRRSTRTSLDAVLQKEKRHGKPWRFF